MVLKKRLPAIILSFALTPVASAGFHKCVDAAGNVTFTDQGCPDSAASSAVKGLDKPPAAAVPSVNTGMPLADDPHTRKIQGLIDAARAECAAGLEDHVRKVHPALRDEAIQLGGVSNKYIRGDSVKISFLGHAKYTTERYSVDRDIECEAFQRGAGTWQVEYFDKPYNLGIQFGAPGDL